MALNGLFCADVPLRNYSLTNGEMYSNLVILEHYADIAHNFVQCSTAVSLAKKVWEDGV